MNAAKANTSDQSGTAETAKNDEEAVLQSAEKGTTADASKSAAGSSQTPGVTEPGFPQFDKLPLEVRLKIWAFAAPDPCIVHQQPSFHLLREFRYIRDSGKVPGVLHACRESRYEFLDDGSDDKSLERRRKEHPVYKLHFAEPRSRSSRPIFFSTNVDSFWGKDVGWTRDDRRLWARLGKLDVASTLKSFVDLNYVDVQLLLERFPKLESITILMDNRQPYWRRDWQRDRAAVQLWTPEVNGELDVQRLSIEDYVLVNRNRIRVSAQRAEFEKKKQNKVWPRIKYRFMTQFLENEGVHIPVPPKDPLADLD